MFLAKNATHIAILTKIAIAVLKWIWSSLSNFDQIRAILTKLEKDILI